MFPGRLLRFALLLAALLSYSSARAQGNAQLPASVGWFQIPNTNISTLCPPYGDLNNQNDCRAIMSDYNGGQFDALRERFIIYGGGHNGYRGNEIYALNMAANPVTRTLVHDATTGGNLTGPGSCGESNADGTMNSRHNYTGAQYLYWLDIYLQYGGSKADCGSLTNSTWYYNPVSNSWSQPSVTGTKPDYTSVSAAAYYRGDETHPPAVYDFATNASALHRYDPVTQVWTQLTGSINVCTSHTNLVAEIDQKHRFMLVVGQGTQCKILLDSPYTATAVTGCSVKSSPAPGVKWDPVFDDFVMWNGGNTVYFWNHDTDSCTTDTTSTGGPGSAQAAGTYGRWNYDPQNGVFLAVNSISTNVFAYRRATVATLQNADWTARSTAAGVLAYQGFDTAGAFTVNNNTGQSGMKHSSGSAMVRDLTTFTHPPSSARCDVPAQVGAHPCDEYWQIYAKQSVPFTIFVQFRQRMTQTFISQHPQSSGGQSAHFKQIINASWEDGTCALNELTQVNWSNRDYPNLYTECGAGQGSQVPLGGAYSSDYLNENGDACLAAYSPAGPGSDHGTTTCNATMDAGYNCHYTQGNNTATSCATYPADVWVTYYIKFHVEAWGAATGTIEAWRALPGQPYKKYTNVSQYTFRQTTSGGFDLVDLLAYYTARNSGVAFGQDGSTWYDELIISTQPIALPMAPVTYASSGSQQQTAACNETLATNDSLLAVRPQAKRACSP